MNASGKRAPGEPARRLAITSAVAATIVLAFIAIAVAARPASPSPRAVTLRPAVVAYLAAAPPAAGRTGWLSGVTKPVVGHVSDNAPAYLELTALDRQDCPAAATACVDLTRHITWLQDDGRVTFGPVRMEPGKPGTANATPRGTFHVQWKAGPGYISTSYDEPMPWATFFAPGGIAFHGGSLTAWSHGCVHLTDSDAHYYNEHLPIGAEVVVF